MKFDRLLIIWVVLTIFLITSTALPLHAAKQRTPVGIIVGWNGDVFIYHADESRGAQIYGMEAIYEKDTVVTSLKSRVKILMKDDSVLSLGENSRVLIKKYSVTDADNTRISVLKIISGRMQALIGKVFRNPASSFQLETPTAAADIKGTHFIVTTDENESELLVIYGGMEAKNIQPVVAGMVALTEGFASRIQAGKPPAEPFRVTYEQIVKLTAETVPTMIAKSDKMEKGCIECHEKTYTAMSQYRAKHPRAADECAACHMKSKAKEQKAGKNIAVNSYTTEAMVFIDAPETSSFSATLKVRDKNGSEATIEEVDITPASGYELIAADETPPAIKNIRLADLQEGVFNTATIAWDTDKYSTSQIEYGLSDKYGSLSLIDDNYTKEHEITLPNLALNGVYHIRTISKDASGNTARSDDFTFKLRKTFIEKVKEAGEKPAIEDFRILKIGTKYAAAWKTSKKTTALVSISGVKSEKNAGHGRTHFPELAPLKYTGLESCSISACHQKSSHASSAHPVGALSWDKFNKPADLPLMQNAVVICSTCHAVHGGEYEYFIRKPFTQLCTSCHRDQM